MNRAPNKNILEFRKYLKQLNLKRTPERERVVLAAMSFKGHFEADELLVKLRKEKSKVAKGTIYRSLKLMVDSGLLRQVVSLDRHMHYEPMLDFPHHAHLICLRCGRVIEFDYPNIDKALDSVCKYRNFSSRGIKLEITGVCKKCSP